MQLKKRKPATKVLLSLLAQTGKTTIDFYTFLNTIRSHQRSFILGGRELIMENKKLENEYFTKLTLKRLKEQNYLRAEKIGRRLMITLTAKGTQTVLTTKLKQAITRTDGLVTVVIFDIPRSQNQARRKFRWLLRQGGFIKLQQSVWASRVDTYKLIANYIKQTKLHYWVNVFQSKNFLNPPKFYSH